MRTPHRVTPIAALDATQLRLRDREVAPAHPIGERPEIKTSRLSSLTDVSGETSFGSKVFSFQSRSLIRRILYGTAGEPDLVLCDAAYGSAGAAVVQRSCLMTLQPDGPAQWVGAWVPAPELWGLTGSGSSEGRVNPSSLTRLGLDRVFRVVAAGSAKGLGWAPALEGQAAG